MNSKLFSMSLEHARKSLLGLLPGRVKDAIFRLGLQDGFSELRLRVGEHSGVISRGEWHSLGLSITENDINAIYLSITRGELYLHRDSIARGYITTSAGIRVGIAGTALFDAGRCIGISAPRALVFRLPYFDAEIGRALAELICDERGGVGSSIIYSPPSGGKTTALRSLCFELTRRGVRRIVVVDERGEFSPELGRETGVEILRGYPKRVGIEISVSVLSPELIITDELSAEDIGAIGRLCSLGVSVIATMHAGSLQELMHRLKGTEVDLRGTKLIEILKNNNRYYPICQEANLGD